MGPTSLRRSRDAWTPTRACEPRKVPLTITCTNCKQYGYAIALDLNITPKAKCLLFTHTHTLSLFLHNSSSWSLSSSHLLRLYETIINIWWFFLFYFFCHMPKKYFSNHFSRLQKITTFPKKMFSPKNFFSDKIFYAETNKTLLFIWFNAWFSKPLIWKKEKKKSILKRNVVFKHCKKITHILLLSHHYLCKKINNVKNITPISLLST
jgi:hypothetical protein